MRGQRLKRADAETADLPEGEVIDVFDFKPQRISSKKWRELVKKVDFGAENAVGRDLMLGFLLRDGNAIGFHDCR